MPTRDEELVAEQSYFDRAADWRERTRLTLDGAAGAAANTGGAARIRKAADEAMLRLRGAGDAVAFGKFEQDGARWYVGYHAIHDDQNDHLVVNWAAPVAAPYYEATAADPLGLETRRDFTCDGNTVVDFEDFHFETLAREIEELTARGEEPKFADSLLEDLSRRREGEMRDIVKTIQAAQYGIIREAAQQLLIVQGGPGTGKTAVALHRVAWLLYNNQEQLQPEDFLIVGPTQTFMRYIAQVLPSLGDDHVRQLRLPDLAPNVRWGRSERSEVSRLKGDARMMSLIERGLRDRISVPDDELSVTLEGTVVRLDDAGLRSTVDRLLRRPYAAGRNELRTYIRDSVRQRIAVIPANDPQIENILERIWPQLSPQAFLRDLFGSRDRLLSAAVPDFSAEEVQLLYRQAAERIGDETWSEGDVALLDAVAFAMTGETETAYRHIVVDEAQDLTPMELEMIARRSNGGAMTILGDIAQSTGVWSRDSWTPVIDALRSDLPVQFVELEFGYRVPRQVFDYAARILPVAAPGVAPPKVVRDGPADPELVEAVVDDVGDEVVAAAQRHLSRGLNVGVICPDALWETVSDAFRRHGVEWADGRSQGLSGPISMITPTESKGLEFDAVVVAEPNQIVDTQARGLRLLYVALTRTLRFLTVIHSGVDLPLPEADAPLNEAEMAAAVVPLRGMQTEQGLGRVPSLVARGIAEDLRSSLHPSLWGQVISEVQRLLEDADS